MYRKIAAVACNQMIKGRRLMGTAAKGSSRAAVHGRGTPEAVSIDRKKAAEEIERGKHELEKTIKETEEKVGADSIAESSNQ